ncbi:hypothetical protein AGMMS4952_19950 [Spirochaetia bacterium]|nr:hypothetical protein AGMMS4952_19950 [Spirochaetia bacterium]
MKQSKIFWIVFLAALVYVGCGDSLAQPAADVVDVDDDGILLSIGANAVTEAIGEFTIWRHPPVANHPTLDFGVVITGYSGSAGALTIPATLDGSPVIGIGDFAFGNNTSITSITIPTGVKGIGDYVFQNCTALTSITLPTGIKKIKNGAFSGCTALASFVIPGTVTKIEHYAFNGCSNLETVTLPVTKVKIENTAFVACPALDAASQAAIRAMGYKGTF